MANKVTATSTFFDKEKKIWSGPHTEMEMGPAVSLGRSILEALQKRPEHINQIIDGRIYSNQEILIFSVRIAQHLQSLGVEQEDVIGIIATNTDFIAPLVFGLFLCGAILSPLDPSFDKDGIRHTFSITKPKIVFCDFNIYDKVQNALDDIGLSIPIYTTRDRLKGVHQIQELFISTEKEDSFQVTPLKLGSSQTAAIVCSSGTTGLPKGVCLSHESLLNCKIFEKTQEDRLLCFSTLYWASGLICLVDGTLSGHTRIITDEPYSPELFLKLIEQYRINIVFTPPSQMAMAIRCPDFQHRFLSTLETYICGGSAIPPSVVEEFSSNVTSCKIVVGYGITEAGLAICFGPATQPGANGQLKANITMKIVDDDGNRLGIGESGEICIRTPYKWAGYYGNPKATQDAVDSEGFICSGDIGYFDEDGALVIVGRKKEILKYNNFHFFPGEIEDEIFKIPGVMEVCVCGIPDIVSTFLPAAAVVKVPGSKLSEEDIVNHVADKMAHFKHLRGGVYFVDFLPKTASGKNVRAKCAEIVEEMRNKRKDV